MKRRWFQFRLRTLFALLTLAAVVTGIVQHVRHVHQRLRYHQALLKISKGRRDASTNEKLISQILISTLEDADWVDEQLPQGHLLHLPKIRFQRASAEFERTRLKECEQEIAASERAAAYHERQIKLYEHALWQPWTRVAEHPSLEVSDQLLGTKPPPPPTFVPVVPPLPSAVDDQPSQPAAQLELTLPTVPTPPVKARFLWESIERPLPLDFDERDVQVERAVKA